MKLKDALLIGKDCELTTLDEAMYNIQLHSMNIFSYSEEEVELQELYIEYKKSKFTLDMTIDECLEKLKF